MADGVDSLMYEFGAGKSAIREVCEKTFALKERGETDFWDFSIGNPSTAAPEAVNQAVRDVMEEFSSLDLHGYSPNNGWESTRAAIADNLNGRFEAGATADDLTLTAGCAGAITATIGALTVPGEDVIVLTPYFPEYRMYIQAWHCRCVEVPTTPETFQIDVDAIERAITRCTRMVIINTPNNPTGAVYDEAFVKALGDLLRRESERLGRTIYLLSDEPYREICYDGLVNPWVPDCYENTIVAYSYSKSLSLPGERIGYAYVPKSVTNQADVIMGILGAQRAVNTIQNSTMQRMIERCVDLTADLSEYDRKRAIIYDGLKAIGYDVVRPDGAFYLWVRALEPDDVRFAERAADEQRLYIVNSTDFGCPGWERLSYAIDDERLQSCLPAFKRLWDTYGGYAW